MTRESYGAMKQGSKKVIMKGREGGREGRRRVGGSRGGRGGGGRGGVLGD